MIKRILIILISMVLLTGCSEKEKTLENHSLDYKELMRTFVITIKEKALEIDPEFLVIPQNGLALIQLESGQLHDDYIEAADGFSQESLFVGYSGDNKTTPLDEMDYLLEYIVQIQETGKTILAIHYTDDLTLIEKSKKQSDAYDIISVYADRQLSRLPNETQLQEIILSPKSVTSLSDVGSVLYLINPENYEMNTLIQTIAETDYDLIVIDAFDNDQQILTYEQIDKLKVKSSGQPRLVIAYMSIGEAETYRWYFKPEWLSDAPEWLEKENKNWAGNYKVKYWQDDWQNIIIHNQSSYLNKVLSAGFDGVYLDIIDAYEYFEE